MKSTHNLGDQLISLAPDSRIWERSQHALSSLYVVVPICSLACKDLCANASSGVLLTSKREHTLLVVSSCTHHKAVVFAEYSIRRTPAIDCELLAQVAERIMPEFSGIVKRWSNQKGFGFIGADREGAEDVFVHQSELKMEGYRCLTEGEKVRAAAAQR